MHHDADQVQMTRAEVIAGLRRGHRLSRGIEVQCDSTRAIGYRDLLDLYAALFGVRRGSWHDPRGRTEPFLPARTAMRHLLRDLVQWPALYARYRNEVARLGAERGVVQRPTQVVHPIDRALFLRTDHWFNVVSGGSVGHLSGVLHGLRGMGIATHVVSTDYLAGIEQDDHFSICEPDYQVGRNLPGIPELRYNTQLLRFIEPHWAQWRPGFVYQRYSLGNYAGVALKHRYRVPYICEYNGSFIWMSRQWGGRHLFHEKLMGDVELLNVDAADIVVVVSQPMKDELVERGIVSEKILVNPNGVDPDRYSPMIDGSTIRAQLGLGDRIVVGFIGTFGRWHGAEVLAESFGRLLHRCPDYRDRVRLLMIGDGPCRQTAEDSLRKIGASAAAIFTGNVPQAQGPTYLAACDILVAPHVPNPDGTPFFGSPTKLFEYMAMGRGIVASRLDQIGEILEHGRTAYLVQPGDVESLAAGLQALVDDATLRDRLGHAARVEVVAHYTWREHTRKIIEKLRERCG